MGVIMCLADNQDVRIYRVSKSTYDKLAIDITTTGRELRCNRVHR